MVSSNGIMVSNSGDDTRREVRKMVICFNCHSKATDSDCARSYNTSLPDGDRTG